MFPVFVGGGWAGGVPHNFWEIWRGVRANLPLLRGGILCISKIQLVVYYQYCVLIG